MENKEQTGRVRGGDREETGDLEARRTDGTGPGGSGVPGGQGGSTGHVTGRPDALAAGPGSDLGTAALDDTGDIADLTIHDASDADLGLTDIGDIPPEDWAANTGPTRTGESSAQGVDEQLAKEDRLPNGREVQLKRNKREKRPAR